LAPRPFFLPEFPSPFRPPKTSLFDDLKGVEEEEVEEEEEEEEGLVVKRRRRK